ncbi:uncharacterized protein E5676_scaffold64G00260 [Cucumis melo var. makuwa]|uniref:Uncharacterized protein n=1 Tax=Cucumis melo var. makuwa TaxID=1194695 RepID=A0A5D3E186_CUCMM|nr:uncharacterized protein E5676_scaffold64G00260 [Cucumis melo var. makuwa]
MDGSSPAIQHCLDSPKALRSGIGACIVLIFPEKRLLPYSFALAELCSNNVAEYQLSLQYDVKHEDLKPYFAYA